MRRIVPILSILLLSHTAMAGQLTDALEREGVIAKPSANAPSLRDQALFRLEHDDNAVMPPPSERHGAFVVAPPRQPQTDFDSETGEFRTLVPAGPNGAVDPMTGTFYRDIGNGYINTRTGHFVPKR